MGMGMGMGMVIVIVSLCVQTFAEGPMAFYKGFIPNFGRIGSWNVAMFLSFEQIKKLVLKGDDDEECD